MENRRLDRHFLTSSSWTFILSPYTMWRAIHNIPSECTNTNRKSVSIQQFWIDKNIVLSFSSVSVIVKILIRLFWFNWRNVQPFAIYRRYICHPFSSCCDVDYSVGVTVSDLTLNLKPPLELELLTSSLREQRSPAPTNSNARLPRTQQCFDCVQHLVAP